MESEQKARLHTIRVFNGEKRGTLKWCGEYNKGEQFYIYKVLQAVSRLYSERKN